MMPCTMAGDCWGIMVSRGGGFSVDIIFCMATHAN